MAIVIHHSRVQWHVYDTPNRHWNQHPFQSEINQEEQQLCLHPKSSRTHQSHRRPHSRSWVYAKIHDNHYPPILQTRKLDNWATQPKRQMETCWPTNDKRVRIRRLHQQQPPQLIVRCSPTLAEDINYHNTWFQKSAAYSLGCYIGKLKKVDSPWCWDVRSKDDNGVVSEAHIPESTSQKI